MLFGVQRNNPVGFSRELPLSSDTFAYNDWEKRKINALLCLYGTVPYWHTPVMVCNRNSFHNREIADHIDVFMKLGNAKEHLSTHALRAGQLGQISCL